MRSQIIAPFVLLASLSVLSSCTSTTKAPDPIPVTDTSSQTPVVVKDTGVSGTSSEMPPVAPTPVIPTPETTSAPAPSQTSTGTSTPSSVPVTKTETITYTTPAGSDSIEFSITIDNGFIARVSSTTLAEHDISKKRQEAFANAIFPLVIGKKIADLELVAVGGSSLTTAAFNEFIKKI